MPYFYAQKATLQNIVVGDLTGKGGFYLRVHNDESGIGFRDGKDYYTNDIMNADSYIFHYDMSIVSYTGSNITTIQDQGINDKHAHTISGMQKSSTTQNAKYFSTSTAGYFSLPYFIKATPTQSFMFAFLMKPTTSFYLFTSWKGGADYKYRAYYDGTSFNFERGNSILTYSMSSSSVYNTNILISGGYNQANNTMYLNINGEQKATLTGSGTFASPWSLALLGFIETTDTNGSIGSVSSSYNGSLYSCVFAIDNYDAQKLARIEGRIAYNFNLSSSCLYSLHPYYGVEPYTN